MTNQKYNGWANYETWACKLWIDNDEGLYTYVRDEASEYLKDVSGLAGWLESHMMETLPEGISGLASDLLNASFSRIEWYEIAKSILSEIV